MAKARKRTKRPPSKKKVVKYPPELRKKFVALMMLPDGPSANELSKETEISQTTLSKWLREARQKEELKRASRSSRKAQNEAVAGEPNNVVFLAKISVPREILLRAVLESDEPVIDLATVIQAQTGTDN